MNNQIKEIVLEINGKKYRGFLYEIDSRNDKAIFIQHGIDELDLSVRSYNCLKRANINTFYDIKETTLDRLVKIKNLGKKSLREVYYRVYKVWHYIIPSGEDKLISELAEKWRKTDFGR